MTKWLVSDTHLFHEKLIQFQRHEYKTIQDMNSHIIDMWKATVLPEDTVYHLGDFAFGTDFEAIENIVKELPGKVTLLLGNHDTPKKVALYTKYWKVASAISLDGFVLSHMPIHPMLLEENTPRSNGMSDRHNIHGHTHRGTVPDPRYFNMNWDVLGDRKFLPLQEVRDILKSRTQELGK